MRITLTVGIETLTVKPATRAGFGILVHQTGHFSNRFLGDLKQLAGILNA
jgi:hypothetical protein